MAGDVLSGGQRRRLGRLVHRAEKSTGLQLAVYVGPVEEDPAEHADRLLAEAGVPGLPAVLILVAPEARRIEIRTSPVAKDRVSDEAAERAVAAMRPPLADGDLVAGLAAGLAVIAAAAGKPVAGAAAGPELPDVLSP